MRAGIRVLTVASMAAVVTLAGCQSAGNTDKAGTTTIQLKLASIDNVNDNGQSYGPQAFVDALSQVSGGKIKAQVVTGFHEGDPEAESQLVAAIAAGDVDGGWPSTRAFAAAGIVHLRSVEAPFTITSYAAEQDLVTGPVSTKLLSTLAGTGVRGLGLAAGPLRRPFAAKDALLDPEDWTGIRIRSYNSPTQSQTFHDLGAVPVVAGFDWPDKVRAGELDAAEFDLAQYVANDLGAVTSQVTSNVVLWPKVFVLSLSQKRFDSLNQQQRGWVTEAAQRAVQASVTGSHDESALAARLCGAGLRFHRASPAQLIALRKKVSPSLAALSADPIDGPLLHDVQAVAAKWPATDDPMPSTCKTGSAAGGSAADQPIPGTPSNLPDGQYRVSVTQQDLTSRQISHNDGATGLYTLTVKDATYQIHCQPIDLPGTDCGHDTREKTVDAGDLKGSGNSVYFVFRPELKARLAGCTLPATNDQALQNQGHCGVGGGFSMTWSLTGDALTLTDSDPQQVTAFEIKPWRKIA